MRGTKYVVLLVAVVAALALTTPLIAQEQKTDLQILNSDGVRSVDLGTLQGLEPPTGARSQGISVHVACTPITCSQCVWLDTYNSHDIYSPSVPGSNLVNTATTPDLLAQGVPYLITITGTTSYWDLSSWQQTMIGSPGTIPLFLSPAVQVGLQGYTGFDWEFVFAYPNDSHGDFLSGGPLRASIQGISLDNGANFLRYTPLGGLVYHSNHSYQYLVEGQGQRAAFRITDNGPHSDNYGRFRICIQKLLPCGVSE